MLNPAQVSVSDVMTRNPITASPSATIDTIASLMMQHHISCIPIVNDVSHPAGIVTKLDLIECRGEDRATAREIMMPIPRTLPTEATLADAASLLSDEGFHHVLVVDAERTLVGIVSTFDVARWVARQA